MTRRLKLNQRPGSRRSLKLSALALGTTAVSTSAGAQIIRFDEPVVFTETGRANFLVSADLDRDAHVDVIVTGGGAVNVYFNDGAGGLGPEMRIPYQRSIANLAASDLDGDQHVDLIWFEELEDRTHVLSVWYNGGDGRSGEVVHTPMGEFTRTPAVVWDLTGDGLDDIIYSAAPATVDAFINQGDRTFALTRLFEYDLPDYTLGAFVPGDFDNDGDVDIAATFQYIYYYRYKTVKGTNVSILMNDRQTPFRLGPEIPLPWSTNDVVAQAMTAGDLDGDGDVDVVVAGSPGNDPGPNEFVILENEAARLFIAHTHRSSEGWPQALALADIDTDGRLDVVFATTTVRGVYVLRNTGGFEFEGVSPFPTTILGSIWSSMLGIADLDGNGQFDLMHGGSTGFAVLFNRTNLRGPRLTTSTLVRGHAATFVVHGARPGESVHYLSSGTGVGRTRGQQVLGGMTLDLRAPIVHFATARADSQGVALLRRRIPANAALGPVSLQAVIRRGPNGVGSVKTPFRTVLVQD